MVWVGRITTLGSGRNQALGLIMAKPSCPHDTERTASVTGVGVASHVRVMVVDDEQAEVVKSTPVTASGDPPRSVLQAPIRLPPVEAAAPVMDMVGILLLMT